MDKQKSWCQIIEEKAVNELNNRSCEEMKKVIRIGDFRELKDVTDCLKAQTYSVMLKEICQKQKKFEIGM
jgi:hypothetical protein